MQDPQVHARHPLVTGFRLLALSITVALVAAGCASEQKRPPPRLDSDGDGYVSREEYTERAERYLGAFDDLDVDGDGRLSREELPAPTRERGRERRGGPRHQ